MVVSTPLDRPAPAAVAADSPAMRLARAAAAGDEVATGQLLRMLAPHIRVVVRAIMGPDHPDADDALQHSLIGFVRALPAFRGECDPAGYASRIAVRTAVAARKRARTHQGRHDAAGAEERPETLTPQDPALTTRRKEALRELLTALPPEQGETLAMRVVLGWSLDEIATHTGAPVNTVRSRMRLAKEAMRRRIESDPALLEILEPES